MANSAWPPFWQETTEMARDTLIDSIAVPAAGTYTTPWLTGLGEVEDILAEVILDWGSGGTTIKVFLQTSIDGGVTAIDIACFAFATADASKVLSVDARAAVTTPVTPSDGTLADNTVVNGIIGDRVRFKYIVAGTYAASTLSAHVQTKD